MSKKKIVSIVIDVILVGIILLLGYVQIAMLLSKNDASNHGVPRVFGKSFLYVATNSMDDPDNPDCLRPGTGIIIEKVTSYEDLKVSEPIYGDKEDPTRITDYKKDGDIVTFALILKAGSVPDTHRLIGKYYNESTGKYTFRTMGDNPDAHKRNIYEEWEEDKLIGKVVYHSMALGSFLSIASPDAARDSGKTAWFFPVAIVSPIIILAAYYIVDAIIKYRKEEKAIEAKINQEMIEAGIDMNDEEAVELFRMKAELRIEYQEEYKKMKEKIRKEMEKQNEKK